MEAIEILSKGEHSPDVEYLELGDVDPETQAVAVTTHNATYVFEKDPSSQHWLVSRISRRPAISSETFKPYTEDIYQRQADPDLTISVGRHLVFAGLSLEGPKFDVTSSLTTTPLANISIIDLQ